MKRTRLPLAIAGAAVLGCAAFLLLLPWGDPCSFVTPRGEAGCSIVLSTLQQNLRNAVFAVICLCIGFAAGSFAESVRILAGALSTLPAVILASFAARVFYRIDSVADGPWTRSAYVTLFVAIAALVVLGAIGGALSKYIRLTNGSRGRNTQ
jgi:lysylphosphatidylglycerol synthetase-like protein (DUF2156 family)